MKIEELYQLFLASDGVSTDTREIVPNTLFFALKGANFNGNSFANQAIEEGCSYAIVDEEIEGNRIIKVDSVLQTLQDLANHHRKQFDIPVLGITGSNGKTTSKELIGAVLQTKYNLLITEGNLNNHLGVPFTLLRLTAEHDFAVIEMGANKPGDIKELVEIAEPTHGVITNIGAAHIEGFGSLEGVIRTKTEMYDFLEKENGVIFYNAEDEILAQKIPDVNEVIPYGGSAGDVQGEVVKLDPFVYFKWNSESFQSEIIKTNLVGKYNFTNFLCAAAIGNYFGVEPLKIGVALKDYVPSNNRSQVQKTSKNTLIVDCYNANATSMAAAIESFEEVETGPKLAILGDMLELGQISQEEHLKVIQQTEAARIKTIFVGAEFQKAISGQLHFQSVQDLLDSKVLKGIEDYTVLLKGSRGIQLEKLIETL